MSNLATQKQVAKAFAEGSPMQQLFGAVFERLGGLDFMEEWAEEHPGEFMRLFIAVNPPLTHNNSGGGVVININPELAAPIDVKAEVVND
jgi:phage terminase large subunit-like protein